MKLLDTSIWIEWLTGSTLANRFKTEFSELGDVVIPCIVQYELYKWTMRERSEMEADQLIAFSTSGLVVQLDTGIATLAAELSLRHKLHATDALVYATSIASNAPLVTCDAHFRELPHVEYHEKV